MIKKYGNVYGWDCMQLLYTVDSQNSWLISLFLTFSIYFFLDDWFVIVRGMDRKLLFIASPLLFGILFDAVPLLS